MHHSVWLDFASPWCWGLILTFWLLFTLVSSRLQSWLWAGANLTLIGLVLGLKGVGVALGGVGYFYVLAQGISRQVQYEKQEKHSISSSPQFWLKLYFPLSIFTALFLFITHKTEWILQANSSLTKEILSVVGFSYVCLRIIDLMRTLQLSPQWAPTFIDTLNYLLPFHMLTAGPIQKYSDFVKHLPSQNQTLSAQDYVDRWLKGGERIAMGLVKKYCIAGLIQGICLTQFSTQGWALFVEAHLFYIWLYFDFSAYSDLAVGVGHLCGLHTPENFNKPLSARNLTVFWERWHISLSLWIRSHLYTPIQLHLARKTRNARPLLISTFAFSVAFLLCGAWHNVSFRFVCWGGLHALGLSTCNAYKHYLIQKWGRKTIRKTYMKNKWIQAIATLITFEFVALSLVFAFHPTLFSF